MEERIDRVESRVIFEYLKRINLYFNSFEECPKIKDFLLEFAREHKLEFKQDSYSNIILKNKSTQENNRSVILQSNMPYDQIASNIQVINEHIKADGYNMAFQKCISLATILALLTEKTADFPNIIAIFTKNAQKLNFQGISAEYLINLDSFQGDCAIVASSAGVLSHIKVPVEKQISSIGGEFYQISISGLQGGHSGIKENLYQPNAVVLIARILERLDRSITIELVDLNASGVEKRILDRASAVIKIKHKDLKKLELELNRMQRILTQEYEFIDPEIKVYIRTTPQQSHVYKNDVLKKLYRMVHLMPHGVCEIGYLDATKIAASNNLHHVTLTTEEMIFKNYTRSFSETKEEAVLNQLKIIAAYNEAKFVVEYRYPKWEARQVSKLKKVMSEVYFNLKHQELSFDALATDLVCGAFQKKVDSMEMISIGPEIKDMCTSREKIHMDSIHEVYIFLKRTLEVL